MWTDGKIVFLPPDPDKSGFVKEPIWFSKQEAEELAVCLFALAKTYVGNRP